MLRKSLIFIMIPSLVMAHDGLHFHPHGVEFGWLIAALIGGVAVVGGGVALLKRARK